MKYDCRLRALQQKKIMCSHFERFEAAVSIHFAGQAFDGVGIAVAKNPFHVNDGGKAANDGKLLGSCLLVQLL